MRLRCVFVAYDAGEDPGSQHQNGEWHIMDDNTGWLIIKLPNNVDHNHIVVIDTDNK